MDTTTCPGEQNLDPRVRRTRRLIEDAFRALAAERPFSEISVGAVTDRATVNRATFYAHYRDKEDLASSVVSHDLGAELFGAVQPGTPLTKASLVRMATALNLAFEKILGKCPKHADDFGPTMMKTLQSTVQTFVRLWLEHDAKAMAAFPGAGKDDVATVLAWSLFGSAMSWTAKERRRSAEETAERAVSLLMH